MPLTPEAMKLINTNSIYKTLIELGSATKQEISDKTQISLTTIRSICEELLLKQQIIKTELDISSGGRCAQRYILNPDKNLIMSLYFETEQIIYQITNLNGKTIENGTKSFNISSITNFIDLVMEKWNICAIGIGVNGIADKGNVYSGCDINELKKNDLGETLQKKYGIQIILENKINAIAYDYVSDYISVHDKCPDEKINLAYIHFGKNGVRAGFVSDGKIIHGASKFAGELGFMPVSTDKKLFDFIQSSFGFENSIDVICRTIAIISCVINPALVVLSSDFLDLDLEKSKQLHDHLKKYYLSQMLCPKILVAQNYQEKYLSGLKKLTLEHITPLFPL